MGFSLSLTNIWWTKIYSAWNIIGTITTRTSRKQPKKTAYYISKRIGSERMSILNNNIKMEAESLVRSNSRDRLTSPTISSSANISRFLTKTEKMNGDLGQEVTSGLNNNLISQKSGGNKGMLPSFSDILWCTDVDGDVMSSPLDSTMVRIRFLDLKIAIIITEIQPSSFRIYSIRRGKISFQFLFSAFLATVNRRVFRWFKWHCGPWAGRPSQLYKCSKPSKTIPTIFGKSPFF